MSASATNVNRDTTAADYLNWLRLYAQSQQAAGTAGSSFTPNYILQFADGFTLSDSVALGPVETMTDSFVLTDAVTLTTSDHYEIGTAQIGFSSV